MLKLRFKNNKQHTVWLVEPQVSLGRSADNAVVVDDKRVLPKHALISVSGEQLILRNISGTDAVKLNRLPVEDCQSVDVGDVITLGETELEVIDPKQALSESKPRPSQVPTEPLTETTDWALKANHRALSHRVYRLAEKTLLGRAKECDISLAASHLSRRHAQLVVRNGALYVKDLDSANGTYVNGQRISTAKLNRGDELRFDNLSFGVIGPASDLDKTTIRAQSVPKAKDSPNVAGGAGVRVNKSHSTTAGNAARQSHEQGARPAVTIGQSNTAMTAVDSANTATKPGFSGRRFIQGLSLLLLLLAGLGLHKSGIIG